MDDLAKAMIRWLEVIPVQDDMEWTERQRFLDYLRSAIYDSRLGQRMGIDGYDDPSQRSRTEERERCYEDR